MKKIFFLIFVNILFFSEIIWASFILKEAKSTGLFLKTEQGAQEIINIILKNNTDKDYKSLKISIENRNFFPKFIEKKDVKHSEEIFLKYKVFWKGEEKIKEKIFLEYDGKKDIIEFEFLRDKPDLKIFIVTHFHYDPVWISKKGQVEYAEKAIDLVKQYIEICRIFPYWSFVLHELSYLKPFWDFFPEYRKEIRDLIKNENLEIVGGTYNQPDQANPSGEALIRNFIYGRTFQEKIIKADVSSGWQIDCFGHTFQYPQLLKKAGISSYTFLRGGPPSPPYDFLWVSPDSTGIYSYDLGGPREVLNKTISEFGKIFQGQSITPFLIKKAEEQLLPALIEKLRALFSTKNIFIPAGDDFSPPLKELSLLASYINGKYLSPQIIFTTPKKFFEIVKNENTSPRIVSRDLNPVFSGCYTTRIDLKIANRLCENSLISAEKFSTIAYLLGGGYPSNLLDKSWRALIFNQHHDCVPGTSNELSTLDIISLYRESLELSSLALNRALNFICKNIDTGIKPYVKDAKPLIVFNSLPYPRKDIVRVKLDKQENFSLIDSNFKKIPYTVENGELLFIEEIPSFGYKVFYLVPSPPQQTKRIFKDRENEIENEYYKITLSNSGVITSIYDKENKKEIIDRDSIYFANEIIAQKENRIGDSLWTISFKEEVWRSSTFPSSIEREENPVFSKIVVGGNFLGCKRRQEIILYKGIKRIDFKTYITGYTRKDYFFKIIFPLNIKNSAPFYDERFTGIYRNENLEFPAYNFVDLKEGVKLSLADLEGKQKEITLKSCAIVINKHSKSARDSALYLIENLRKFKITSCMFFEKPEKDENSNITIYIGDIPEDILNKFSEIEKNRIKKMINFRKIVYFPENSTIFLKEEAVKEIVENLKEKNSGIALINSGNTGYCVKGATVTLSLLRSPTDSHSPEYYGFNTSHQNWDHLFCYSLLPHLSEDIETSDVKKSAEEFNNPLIGIFSDIHRGILKEKEFSFLKIEGKNIFLSCLKLKGYPEAEYKSNFKYRPEIIFRIYEYEGKKENVKIYFFLKVKKFYKSNFYEEEVEKLESPEIEILPFSVETFGFVTERKFRRIKEELDIKREFIQPVYSKFYKYNLGVEPIKNQPVSISFEKEKEDFREKIFTKIKISSDYQDKTISGFINFEAPEYFKITPQKIKYRLKPGDYKIFDISIICEKEKSGKIFAFIEEDGQIYFDILKIGEDKKILDVEYPEKVILKEEVEVKVSLKNRSSEKIKGIMFVISPLETWGDISYQWGFIEINPFRQKIEILPFQEKTFTFKIKNRYEFSEKFFAVIKLVYNGEIFYGKPIIIERGENL